MRFVNFTAGLAIAAAVFASTVSAQAASPVTRFFLKNVTANVDFLEKSSRMALTQSDNPRVRAFARMEAREQAIAASAIDLWGSAGKSPLIAMASAEAPLQTGRSVAVAGTPETEPAVMPDTRTPLGAANLDRLASLSGVDFDNLYWQQQYDALSQIETDYVSYIADGDDPVLQGLAQRELKKVERRLESLSKL